MQLISRRRKKDISLRIYVKGLKYCHIKKRFVGDDEIMFVNLYPTGFPPLAKFN